MSSRETVSRIFRDSNTRWCDENTQSIIQWLCIRDDNEDAINLNFYVKDNKIEACRRMLNDFDLNIQRSNILKKKARDKVAQMIKSYKNVNALVNQIEWEMNFIKHDVVTNNIREQTIREMLIKKRSFYYEFDEIMKDSSIINSLYLMNFIRSNLIQDEFTHETDEKDMNKIIDKDYETWIEIAINSNDAANKDYSDSNSLFEEEEYFISRTEMIKQIKQSYAIKDKKISTSTATSNVRRLKRKLKVKLNLNIDDDQSKDSKRESKKNKSIANALIEMQNIKSNFFFKQFEFEQMQLQKRFDAKITQRNQHHKKILLKQKELIAIIKMQHEKKMIRLQIELKKTSQKK
jgi:hypothetical protein